MSIATRTGDDGTTGLMYNRRVAKNHPRIEAIGCVDELNAGLGLARSTSENVALGEKLLWIQKELVVLMGELATEPEDLPRYLKDGFTQIGTLHVERLDGWVAEIEARNITYRGWATPGGTRASAAFDLARTICRRAERSVLELKSEGGVSNLQILKFLNRLADLLWLFARVEEQSVQS